ncbi:hypothetical protein Asppvi_008178 [Aspergillus pseudoviridinutans]|uniref:Uncharacterized protein n=1 Tax=Aspergillus pseudoviridinutans TaxID=1517512 RepID=A0A9P3BDJ3_9EURO|nr:uncharacterized protein Asppvi_005537 [Aspergillus pseudoviridinutans]XP_043159993.1 uncharacterized protein Asppvi_008178 [Aspergillus pseudoviridinutans]GIJ86645.1 hypothetical protein Asppvi_005537 [Aspergillus pseudoviridinutans]GIJ89247.1 hypothetical protein Asppvi_008178 [Aspergillus pseudoviridinutans]
MTFVKKSEAYLQYLELGAEGLTLPPFAENAMGYLVVYPGEVYCRAPGCPKAKEAYSSLNNLKKHIQSAHSKTYTVHTTSGGAPTIKEQQEAIEWYQKLLEEEEKPELPALPLKKDGTVHIKNMKEMVKGMGVSVPCGECKKRKKTRTCCSSNSQEWCENFDYFAKKDDKGKAKELEESEEESEEEESDDGN